MRSNTVCLLLAIPALSAQTATPPGWKEFSIGPPTRNQSGFRQNGIVAAGIPLKRALARAYGLPEHRIIGPSWIDEARYAITALVDDPQTFQPLFQQELTARFHMVARRETKDVPIYRLRQLEGGAKTAPASVPNPTFKVSGTTVTAFAELLADSIKRPVFDETGLDGKFDFSLSWQSGNLASLEAAVKSQLGLQLVPDKRSLEVLIIDRIEKPEFTK